MGCLYSLQSPSGRRYIGITKRTAEARFSKHVEHALGKRNNGVLYSALRKYGPDRFTLTTLAVASWEYLLELERRAIAAFGTRHPYGYNMTYGGEGSDGPVSEAARLNVSAGQRRRYKKPEELDKARAILAKGRETIAAYHAARRVNGRAPWQIRAAEKRAKLGSPEHRAKISAATKAAMSRPEIRAKVKAAQANRSYEWNQRIAASKRGHLYGKRSAEFVAKQVAGIKASWADPVKKAERLAKIRATRALKVCP